jgi:hypothetical protein
VLGETSRTKGRPVEEVFGFYSAGLSSFLPSATENPLRLISVEFNYAALPQHFVIWCQNSVRKRVLLAVLVTA